MNTKANFQEVPDFLQRALSELSNQAVDDLIKQKIAEFTLEIEKKRASMIVDVVAYIMRQYDMNKEELIIRIPVSRI